jgi:hypothetical protein
VSFEIFREVHGEIVKCRAGGLHRISSSRCIEHWLFSQAQPS